MAAGFHIHRLVARGEWGLTCDDEGMAIGPISLVGVEHGVSRNRLYRSAPRNVSDRLVVAIFGDVNAQRQERFATRLAAIAESMSKGHHVLARIAAVQLAIPEISPHTVVRLRKIATGLAKFNPNWAIEPRDSHGRWSGERSDELRVPVIAPFSEECLKFIDEAKERCIKDYARKGGDLGFSWLRSCIRSYVPIHCGY